ncbi:MAG: LysM peptidoglycan-binding domain-containing protein [Actinoallomurus sp.]
MIKHLFEDVLEFYRFPAVQLVLMFDRNLVRLIRGETDMSMSAQARPSVPVRLTRRGRIVVVCVVALMLLVGLWVGARHGARATSGGGGEGSVVVRESVVVGAHDTLWDIAVRARPGVDPRITVQRMIDLNALSSAVVNPGQRVYIPSR